MDHRKFTDEEAAIIQRNVEHFEALFRRAHDKCQNPDCKYPLEPFTDHYFVLGVGHVCDLCHTMYTNVKVRQFFVKAHQDDEAEENRRRNSLGM